ncbi:MAG: M23 family metallopeptidase [Fibrobacter sp.]|nr:M23 family metallopeptidase [Fibrobacter sp.]
MRFSRATIHFQNSSRSVSVRFPQGFLRLFPVVKTFVQLGLVLLFLQTGFFFGYDHLIGKAMEQRRVLHGKLESEQNRFALLEEKISPLFEDEDFLYTKFGLSLPETSERELGVGGAVVPESALTWASSPTFELASALKEKLERTEAQLERNRSSFYSLKNYMERQQANWRNIPSIAPTTGRYASAFGRRTHPITGEVGKMHYGVDISNEQWTPIFAAADGVVDISKWSNSFGNYVVLDHGNGFVTKYGHSVLSVVREGQWVKRYQVIGYMGNTGRSVSSHLHYEVWLNREAVNPLRYMLPNDYAVE